MRLVKSALLGKPLEKELLPNLEEKKRASLVPALRGCDSSFPDTTIMLQLLGSLQSPGILSNKEDGLPFHGPAIVSLNKLLHNAKRGTLGDSRVI